MERCPICRSRLKGQTVCPRCGADLGIPLHILSRARRMERRAVACIAEGDLYGADQALRELRGLRRSPLGQVLEDFIIRCECV